MSLRTRLVLAFFLLSVVPLGAVTFYSYTNNVRALQDAAEREADLLAGELGQRMQLVTAQLGERVEHLMDIAELQAVADEASATAAQAQAAVSTTAKADTPPATNVRIVTPVPGATGATTISQSALNDSIARSLGEAAMLLNNVELQNMRNYGREVEDGRPVRQVRRRHRNRAWVARVQTRTPARTRPRNSPDVDSFRSASAAPAGPADRPMGVVAVTTAARVRGRPQLQPQHLQPR